MPWPEDDIAGQEPPLDGWMTGEDPFEPPQEWRDIVANAPEEPPLDELAAAPAASKATKLPGAAQSGALPPWSRPGPTGYAKWEFPGWDPNASEEEQRAAFEAANERAPTLRGGAANSPPDLPSFAPPPPPGAAPPPILPPPVPVDASPLPELPPAPLPDGLARPDVAAPSAPAPWAGLPDWLVGQQAPSPPQFTPDAVSDASGVPAPVIAPPKTYDSPFDNPDLTAEQLGRQLADMQRTDPERYIRTMVDHADRLNGVTRDRAEQAAKEAIDAEERIAKSRIDARTKAREQRAALEVESTKLANEKVDPERWWSSRKTHQKIAGIFAALVGGLVQSRTKSATNSALTMLDNAIEQDIAAQRENIATKRASITERRGLIESGLKSADEEADAEDLHRLSAYKRVMAGLEAERAKYDPRGTKAMKIAEMLTGVRARAASAADAHEDKMFKRAKDVSELELKRRAQAEAERRARATEARLVAGAANAGDKLLTPAQIKAEFGIDVERSMNQKDINLRLEGLTKVSEMKSKASESALLTPEQIKTEYGIDVPEGMTRKAVGDLVSGKAKAQEITANAPATDLSKEQLERVVPGLKTKDGKPFFAAGVPAEAQKLRNTVALTESLVRIMDNVVRIREKHGWSSDTFKSPEWREAQALWGNAMMVAKGDGVYQLGVIAGPDLDMLGKALGATDPTSVQDPTPGIKKARSVLLDDLNTKAKALDPKGSLAKFDIPFVDPTKKPKSDPIDAAYKEGTVKPKHIDPRVQAELQRRRDAGLEPVGVGIPDGFIDRVVLPEQQKSIDTLEYAASQFTSSSPDLQEQAKRALENLENLSRNGGNEGIRAAALAAANKVRLAMPRPERSVDEQGYR